MVNDEPTKEPMLQFFDCAHLPQHLQTVSALFRDLAGLVIMALPPNPERKDCAVRACLYK